MGQYLLPEDHGETGGAENAEAVRLLIAAPLGAGLKADYKDATGRELTSPDQLLLSGGVYLAAPGTQPAALDRCGVHRCDRVTYQPRGEPKPIRVLSSARLAQIHVPYDDGKNEYSDLTGQDFGQELTDLSPVECPGGTIRSVKLLDPADHNVFWRLDFGLDGPSGTRVEQKDGHTRSYEIVPGPSTKYLGRGFTEHDVYVTEYNPCELFASDNPTCGRGHPGAVDRWVGGQTLTHPVIWMNVGFHHIARDEDQQPMPVHRQGFAIAPRDVTAMNPLTPRDLARENGHWNGPS
ncbi:hypothetical protein AB0G54_21220 [Streptomyces yokosukanensis]|uniref:copper amine oxidase n=1 Tax=Streptomyces yokosukanensis TaxID=67386 RepID=UPI003431DABD